MAVTPAILSALPRYVRKAVRFDWQTRTKQLERQTGSGIKDQGLRSAVTGGAQMDGFIALLTNWVIEAGIDRRHIYHKEGLELPGYFRPAHLVVTSPPYWTLKRYNESENQLGHVADYEQFIRELEKVWREVFRVLVSGASALPAPRRRFRPRAGVACGAQTLPGQTAQEEALARARRIRRAPITE